MKDLSPKAAAKGQRFKKLKKKLVRSEGGLAPSVVSKRKIQKEDAKKVDRK